MEVIIGWCNRAIRGGFYLLFALVPLLLTPWNYELFEYNKMMAVYGLTVLIVSAWLVKMVSLKEIRVAKTPLDIPLLLFFSSQLLSSLFSLDWHISWFGYYSRFNGGMFSVISYVLLFYAFVSNRDSFFSPQDELGSMNHELWKKAKTQKTDPNPPLFIIHNSLFILLKVALMTAVLVAIYGVLERLGIDKHLWVQDVQNRVFSTLGQPNWLAAYLIALTPITLAFSVQYLAFRKNAKSVFLKAISYLLATLFFLVLLFTRSRSGLLGFVVTDILFWGLVFTRSHLAKQKNAWRLPFGVFHLAFGIVLFLNGTNIAQLDKYFALPLWRERLLKTKTTAPVVPNYQAPLLEAGGTESGTIRKYVWQGAINAWKSTTKTMALGTGTETFAFAFYRFKPPEHNLTSEWDFLYNKAHNEYLNYLATTGIFGLGSYLLFIGTFIVWFAKSNQQNKTQSFYPLSAIHYALFAGWISVLITNFFGFSVVMMQLFFFLFPAMVFLLSPQFMIHDSKFKLTIPSWTVWLPIIGGLYILVKIGSFWYADTLFARGYRLAKLEQYSAAQERLARAVKLNPREPLYRDEIATTLAALTEVALESKNATAAAALARQSLIESDLALTASPNNVNFWKSRTKIYYTFSSFDPEFLPAAITALKKALSLSPTDPKILYNLAVLYGRQDDNQQAIETLKTAISLKPNYRDAYFALYIFYNEVKQPQLARAVLTEYLTKVDPNDQDFKERLQ